MLQSGIVEKLFCSAFSLPFNGLLILALYYIQGQRHGAPSWIKDAGSDLVMEDEVTITSVVSGTLS